MFTRNQEIEYISATSNVIRRGRFGYKSGSTYTVYPYPFVDDYPIKFSMTIPEFVVYKVGDIEYKADTVWAFPRHFEYANVEGNDI